MYINVMFYFMALAQTMTLYNSDISYEKHYKENRAAPVYRPCTGSRWRGGRHQSAGTGPTDFSEDWGPPRNRTDLNIEVLVTNIMIYI